MKRFRFIFLGALVILMAGCSKKNLQVTPDEEAWVTDLSLPVPIQFGSSSLLTKALPVDDIEDLKGRAIGIFGIDKNSGADWSSLASDNESILLPNVQGEYDVDEDGRGYIKFQKGPYYYPMTSSQNFSFYGYYVHSATADYVDQDSGEMKAGGYYVPVTIGQTDHLWAKAEAKGDGYNARYIRNIRKDPTLDDMPTFRFYHVTSGLEFRAVAKQVNDDNGQPLYEDADFENIIIREIYVENAITSAKLCVAHKDDVGKAREDQTRKEGKLCEGQGSEKIRTQNATWMKHSPTLGDGTVLGEGLFLYPGKDYDINVVVHTGTLAQPKKDTLVIHTRELLGCELSAGKKYTINLQFDKVEDTKIYVSSDVSWEETFTEEYDVVEGLEKQEK